MDYNKLMTELDSVLGLEKPATESVAKKTKAKTEKAFEGYDDIENELARDLGLSVKEEPSEDFILEEGETQPQVDEPTPEDLFIDSVKVFRDSLIGEGMEEDEARDKICDIVSTLLCPEEPEESEEPEGEVEPEEPEEPEEEPAEEGLVDKLLALGQEEATEEVEAVDEVETTDPESAFEEMEAKMIDRYSSLARKKTKTGSATEGQSVTEVVLDEQAIKKVSCEFNYSGSHLRNLVTEAIKKGVI